MPINAGDLNRRITIRKKASGSYPDGQPKGGWEVVASGVWADIKAQTGMGAIRAAGDVPLSVTRYSMRIRYRTDLDASMQVLEHGPDGLPDESTPYDIRTVQLDKARREWTDLVCELGANNG